MGGMRKKPFSQNLHQTDRQVEIDTAKEMDDDQKYLDHIKNTYPVSLASGQIINSLSELALDSMPHVAGNKE